MSSHSLTSVISAVFADGVQAHGGRVIEAFDDGDRLFCRSLLPWVEEVRQDDSMQGGLAVRATEHEIRLHPYLLRQVCSNGAIFARAIGSWRADCAEFDSDEEIASRLGSAIAACCRKEVFTEVMGSVRNSLRVPAEGSIDWLLSMAPLLSALQGSGFARGLFAQVFDQFRAEREPSGYGLMNAVTAVARDTRDQEQRWRLEELGGGIGASILPQPEPDSDHASRVLSLPTPDGSQELEAAFELLQHGAHGVRRPRGKDAAV